MAMHIEISGCDCCGKNTACRWLYSGGEPVFAICWVCTQTERSMRGVSWPDNFSPSDEDVERLISHHQDEQART